MRGDGESISWPCARCGKEAEVTDADEEGRTFWFCPHCMALGVAPKHLGKAYNFTDARPLYRQAYERLAECFADLSPADSWLLEHRQDIWRELRRMDNEIDRAEKSGVKEKEYIKLIDKFRFRLNFARSVYETANRNVHYEIFRRGGPKKYNTNRLYSRKEA